MEIRRYERNGEVWEVRSEQFVTRYAGEPCTQLDMRGNPETFFSPDTEIIEVCDLGDDWSRYWHTSRDPALRENTRKLLELYEQYASRKGITIEDAQRY